MKPPRLHLSRTVQMPPEAPPPPPGRVVREGFLPRVIANRPVGFARREPEPREAIDTINVWGLVFLGLLVLSGLASLCILLFALERIAAL